MVVDQPGVLATVTAILQKHDISVEGLLQQRRAPGDVVALVMTTHETPSYQPEKSFGRDGRLADC